MTRITHEEKLSDLKLRPTWLREFIGQEKVKDQLSVALRAAKARREPLDHVLMSGPPGLGKTTLATIISNELEVGFQQTTGPTLDGKEDLTSILVNLRPKQVLFLDEIHRMPVALEERLYTALEDSTLDVIHRTGTKTRTYVQHINPFTFVGATTRPGLISAPLRARFGILLQMDFYTDEELQFIVMRSAEVLKLKIDAACALEIARRSRGTPRIANRILRRVRDWSDVYRAGVIDMAGVKAALAMLDIDSGGLDRLDRKLLTTIIRRYKGGPVGLKTLAANLGEEPDALEEAIEPFLIRRGYIDKTPRGRIASEESYTHFGIPMPKPKK